MRDPGQADRRQKSRSDAIAEQLEEAPVTGQIAVGARLGETPIARQFGGLRTSVREPLPARNPHQRAA